MTAFTFSEYCAYLILTISLFLNAVCVVLLSLVSTWAWRASHYTENLMPAFQSVARTEGIATNIFAIVRRWCNTTTA